MSKNKSAFFCQSCGHETPKWLGKCPGCSSWNSFVEEIKQKKGSIAPFSKSSTDAKPIVLQDIKEQGKQENIKVDIILDMVGGDYFKKNLKILNFKGRLTYIAALGGIKGEVNLLHIMNKQLKISGSTLRSRSSELKGKIVRQVLKDVWPLIENGSIGLNIFKKFPMDEINVAHQLMESSGHIGKILLTIKEENNEST